MTFVRSAKHKAKVKPAKPSRPRGESRRKHAICNCIDPGAEYTPDEVEFILAMERFKVRSGKRFPTWTDALKVARELGYARPARA